VRFEIVSAACRAAAAGWRAMSAVETLLSRLEGVKPAGPGRWIARCAAHEDRSPSLSARELDDGRLLIFCFAGCSAADILAAVGLSLADLFPERLTHSAKSTRPNHFHVAREALRAVSVEALLVALAAENIAAGAQFSPEDHARLILAAGRCRAAAAVVA
jgi:hypothetical protein